MSNRLDIELVARGLVTSRERAKEYIKAEKISVNNITVIKPSALVQSDDIISIRGDILKYVGRGGLKLEGAITQFGLRLEGFVCADLGASTGGFTDCMLQNGAKKVYAVDVGHGQLDDKLVLDERVVNIEGMNVKDVDESSFEPVDFACADLSFISCRYAADAVVKILKDNSQAVLLIKPQFEVGKQGVSKGGIVKDKKLHIKTLESLCIYFKSVGLAVAKLTHSPIKGGDGNIEYLVLLVKHSDFTQASFDYSNIVDRAFTFYKNKGQ